MHHGSAVAFRLRRGVSLTSHVYVLTNTVSLGPRVALASTLLLQKVDPHIDSSKLTGR